MSALKLGLMGLAIAGAALLVIPSCYDPQPQNGSFRCSQDQGYLCPEGLRCDTVAGLCVTTVIPPDMQGTAIVSGDMPPLSDRSCDARLKNGEVSGLVNLGAANSAGSEGNLSLSFDASALYYTVGGALFTIRLSGGNPLAVTGSPQAVTIAGGPTTIAGGSFTNTGKFWFAGTSGGTTQLYVAAVASATSFTGAAAHLPSLACPFSLPMFLNNDSSSELYLTAPLAGCGTSSYVVQGAADRNLGAFAGAIGAAGYQNATLLPSGLTLIFSSTGTTPQLQFASRGSTDGQWAGPVPLPLDALGMTSGDVEGLVNPDCSALYLVANRSGGKGGTDLWAAAIAAP